MVLIYCENIRSAPFSTDESDWIGTSYYFEALYQRNLFIADVSRGDGKITVPSIQVWGGNYWINQPPLTRYLVALGRLSGGYSVKDLNPPWSYAVSIPRNESWGAIPSAGLLWWSRLPMALLAAFSWIALIFSDSEMRGAVFRIRLSRFVSPQSIFLIHSAQGDERGSPALFYRMHNHGGNVRPGNMGSMCADSGNESSSGETLHADGMADPDGHWRRPGGGDETQRFGNSDCGGCALLSNAPRKPGRLPAGNSKALCRIGVGGIIGRGWLYFRRRKSLFIPRASRSDGSVDDFPDSRKLPAKRASTLEPQS